MFKPGNKYGKGRPKGSTNRVGKIRDRIIRVLERRVMREKDLDSVPTEALLRFLSGILPKDLSLSVTKDPVINYISQVPRPVIENKQGNNTEE